MLSYQHGYHAGNFADVLKHLTLINIIEYLILKDKPLFYFDTHAGKACYDLEDAQAQKNLEYKNGIELIWQNKDSLPEIFATYIKVIKNLNQNNKLKIYPGSPLIALNTLRNIDRQFYCEKHPQEFEQLKKLKTTDKQIYFKCEDGMAVLNALIPPKEKRGLIFIDPSYELKNDYQDIPATLAKAYTKFNNGVYCIWYPILEKNLHLPFKKSLEKINSNKYLSIEFNSGNNINMYGCGLWIINPPYILKEKMEVILITLCKLFNPDKSSYLIVHE